MVQTITSVEGREAYSFSQTGFTLSSPFGGGTPEASMKLAAITNTRTWQATTLEYNSSGEMTKATMPYGGFMEWEYSDFLYASNKHYREVSNRYLTASAGGARWQYALVFPSQDVGRQLHSFRAVIELEENPRWRSRRGG